MQHHVSIGNANQYSWPQFLHFTRANLLVRAVVKSPELLILDEPCQGLDGANREKVLALMETIREQTETNLIYITHHEEEMIPA